MIERRVSAAALIANTVAVQAIAYAFRPAVAYAALDAGSAVALLGVLSATFALPALILGIPAGHLADVVGERPMVISGALVMTAALALALAASGSFNALLVATFFVGIAHAACIVAQQTLVANGAIAGQRDAAFGWYTLGASLGQAIGPVLLALPGGEGDRPPVPLILLCCLAMCALVVGSAMLMPARSSHRSAAHGTGVWRGAARDVRRPGAVRALIASGLALSSIDITVVYWPALGSERGIPSAVISAMLVARALSTMSSRAFLGWSTRRWGRKAVMSITLSAATAALLLTAVPTPDGVLILAAIVYGVGIGACQPITMSWMTELAPSPHRGAMLSLRLVGNRLVQATIPPFAGLIAAPHGAAGVVVALAGLLGIAARSGVAVPQGRDSLD